MNSIKRVLVFSVLVPFVSACMAFSADQKVAVIDLENYCADAQALVAGTDLPVVNEIHQDYDAFVKSKPSIEPLTTHQFLHSESLPGFAQPMATIISCKLKTSDIIAEVYGEEAAKKPYGEVSCRDVMANTLDQLYAARGDQRNAYARSAIILEEDEVTRMGPMWLKPWPYQNAFTDEAGSLHLRAKALLVPFSKLIPMPDRFKGTHYCHLPTPEYLTAILDGRVELSLPQ